MAMQGMDADRIEAIGAQLKQQGEAINGVVTAVDAVVNHLRGVWSGADEVEFEGWWRDQHRPNLSRASSAVFGLGQSAQNNAQEQRNASF